MQDPFAAQDEASVYVPRPASESALGKMELALAEGAGLVALLGPPGIGKSILMRVLAKRMERSACCVFPDPEAITAEDLFVWIVRELDARDTLEAESALGNRSALNKFREWMLREWRETDTANSEEALRLRAKDLASTGFPLVALIDHAETLGPETVRRLSALAKSSEQALSFVLALTAEAAVGLPWLTAIMPPVTCVDYSEPLSLAETGAYVPERLRRSGAPAHLLACIDEARVRRIYSYSQGIPRRIHGELSLLHIELTRVRAGWGPAQPGGWGESGEQGAELEGRQRGARSAAPAAQPQRSPERPSSTDNAEQELERVLRPVAAEYKAEPEPEPEPESDESDAPILILQGDDATDASLSEAVLSDWSNLSERSVPLSELAQRLDTAKANGAERPAAPSATADAGAQPRASETAQDVISSTDWGTAPAPRSSSNSLRWTAAMGVAIGASAAIGLAITLMNATSEEAPDLQAAAPNAPVSAAAPSATTRTPAAPSAPAVPSTPATTKPATATPAPSPLMASPTAGSPAPVGTNAPAVRPTPAPTPALRASAQAQLPELAAVAPGRGRSAPSTSLSSAPARSETAKPQSSSALQPAAALRPAAPTAQPTPAAASAPVPAASAASAPVAAAAPAPEPSGQTSAAQPVRMFRVNINAIPYATIEIDNEVAGETPLGEYPVAAGKHVFRARMPNGETKERTLEITQNGMRIIFE